MEHSPSAGFLAAASAQAGTPWPEGSSRPHRMWHSGRGPAGSVQTIRKGTKNGIQGKQSRGNSPGWADPPEVLWAGTSHVRAQEAVQTQDGRSPFKAHPTLNEPQCHRREGNSSPSETTPEGPTAFTEPPGEGATEISDFVFVRAISHSKPLLAPKAPSSS